MRRNVKSGDQSPETRSSLLRSLSRKEAEAVGKLMKTYLPFLEAVCKRLKIDPNQIDEAIQETLIAVWQSAPSFERKRAGSFRTWLRTIAERKVAEERRRKSPISGTAYPEMTMSREPDAQAKAVEDESIEIVNTIRQKARSNVRSQLPEQWEIYDFLFDEYDCRRKVNAEKLEYRAAEEHFGKNHNAVTKAVSRVRQALKREQMTIARCEFRDWFEQSLYEEDIAEE